MTYSCTSPQNLHNLTIEVERLISEVREKLPKSEGIILYPEATVPINKKLKFSCCAVPFHRRAPAVSISCRFILFARFHFRACMRAH